MLIVMKHDATDSQVEAVLCERVYLRVGLHELDIRQPSGPGALGGHLEHLRREIKAQD